MPDELLASWATLGKKHLIGPVEMLAVVVARAEWASFLDAQQGVFFLLYPGKLQGLALELLPVLGKQEQSSRRPVQGLAELPASTQPYGVFSSAVPQVS